MLARFLLAILLLACSVVQGAANSSPAPASASASALLLRIDGAIGPAAEEYVTDGLSRAAENGAPLVVLALDTPGGLDTSMRGIIRAILASPVPVAAYVSPGGARAASAGTYILYASHVAAMAPATNLGAATPIAIGGAPEPAPEARHDDGDARAPSHSPSDPNADLPTDALARKRIHDAEAYLTGLAQLRGRNADWAQKAVREGVSLSAQDALQLHVVDLIAPDVDSLLRRIDGRQVKMAGGAELTLHTAGLTVASYEPSWRTRILSVTTDPNLALILLMVGTWGVFFEFARPGAVLPGVVGALCLVLGLSGLQMLPISGAGVVLVIVGSGFLIAEAFFPSHGSLGIGGLIALLGGATMLIGPGEHGFGVRPAVLVGIGLLAVVFLWAVVSAALRARRRPQVGGGREELLGSVAQVETWPSATAAAGASGETGWVRLQGELWRAHSVLPLAAREAVRVIGVDGLTLEVEQLERQADNSQNQGGER